MKNKSGNTNELQKRDSATRSAGKQATGNRNKRMLAAERRRTDEPSGRLNKQNPVSPQNMTPNDKSTELSKTQASDELHVCRYCGMETTQPDDECYKAPVNKSRKIYESNDDDLRNWYEGCDNLK